MDIKLKIGAAFAAGLGCGVAATYLYFRDMYKKKIDDELRSMEKILREMREKNTSEEEKAFEQTGNSIVEMEKRSNELTNYCKATKAYISSVPPADNEMEERIGKLHDRMEKAAEGEYPKEEPGEQYEITSMDWLDDPFYDKVILTYYVGDDTVANEAGQIDDIDMSIGMEMFELFKDSDDMEKYIRNPSNGIDYNIVKEMGCYHAG